MIYSHQNRNGEATQILERALQALEEALGEKHPSVAPILNSLALLNALEERLFDADRKLSRAIEIVG